MRRPGALAGSAVLEQEAYDQLLRHPSTRKGLRSRSSHSAMNSSARKAMNSRSYPTSPSAAGPRPSPTPGSAPPSSTGSPSTARSSRPAPSPTGSPAPQPARALEAPRLPCARAAHATAAASGTREAAVTASLEPRSHSRNDRGLGERHGVSRLPVSPMLRLTDIGSILLRSVARRSAR